MKNMEEALRQNQQLITKQAKRITESLQSLENLLEHGGDWEGRTVAHWINGDAAKDVSAMASLLARQVTLMEMRDQ